MLQASRSRDPVCEIHRCLEIIGGIPSTYFRAAVGKETSIEASQDAAWVGCELVRMEIAERRSQVRSGCHICRRVMANRIVGDNHAEHRCGFAWRISDILVQCAIYYNKQIGSVSAEVWPLAARCKFHEKGYGANGRDGGSHRKGWSE